MILTSEQLEQIIREETEAALREVDMKKIVGKLKKKPAEPVRQKTPEEHYEEAIALVPEKAWGVGWSMNAQIAYEQALGQATDYNNYKYETPYHRRDYDITMPSGQKKRLTILYKNEPMNEIDMKKIGQGIKQTSKKMGQGVKQAVGKLKKKPAQPAPPVEPPLPPDGVSYDPTTKQWQARKTVTVDLAEYPFNFSQSDEDSIRYELEHMLQDNGWPGGSSDLIRKPRPDRGAGKMEVQFTLLAGAREDARNAEMRKRMGLEERT